MEAASGASSWRVALLLWVASSAGWSTCSALVEIDAQLQFADDLLNLSDLKKRERKHRARQLLLAALLLAAACVDANLLLAMASIALLVIAARARLDKRAQYTQAAEIGAPVFLRVSSPALRAVISLVITMASLSVALGHIASPWLVNEIREHVELAPSMPQPGPHVQDLHAHVAAHVKEQHFHNKHLRHLMHLHDVVKGTNRTLGLKHHLKTLGHVVGSAMEVSHGIMQGVAVELKSSTGRRGGAAAAGDPGPPRLDSEEKDVGSEPSQVDSSP